MTLVWEKLLIAQGSVFTEGIQRMPGTVELSDVPPSRHTVDLTAIATDTKEWLLATRLIATDLLQAFGLPEILQIGRTGTIQTHYWSSEFRRYAQWAETLGLAVDGNPVHWQ